MDSEKQKISRQEIEKAKGKSREAQTRIVTINERVLESLVKFYYHLASVSGGAIVVSVTFIGIFSQNLNNKIDNSVIICGLNIYASLFLFVAWFSLLVSLIASIFRNKKHITYMHYDALRMYVESLKEFQELKMELFEKNQIVNKEQFDVETAKKNIKTFDEAIKFDREKSKRSSVITNLCEYFALTFFPLGLFCLIVFGMLILNN